MKQKQKQKQEEVREEIRKVIDTYTDDTCLYPGKDCKLYKGGYCISDEDSYKCLMKRLSELGVGIKVDGELPTGEDCYTASDYLAKLHKAGFGAFEPLIKEVSGEAD